MKIDFLIDFENIDSKGNRYNKQSFKAKSLVKGFLYLLWVQISRVSTSTKRTNGTSSSVLTAANNFKTDAPINTDDYGIVVGTNNTAVSINDYALNTQIMEGTGAGQMTHQAVDFPEAVNVSGSDCRFQIHRDFINNSGGSITINEIGIYVYGYLSYRICIDRTLSTKIVPDTEGASVTYTMLITV